MKKISWILILLAASVLTLSGCQPYTGPNVDVAATKCTAGEAQIGVGDGYLQYLCGCAGTTDGAVLMQPANLICHVPAGTVVYFQYLATQDEHQIRNTGGLSFPSSPPSVPGTEGKIYTFAYQFNDAGTYDFDDAFNSALQGQIVVP